MSDGLTVVVRKGLSKGEVRLEHVAGTVQLAVDSKDTLQAILLGLATTPANALVAAPAR